ncbi:MAG: endonuclease domain-containing protein [Phycisphaerae bacterium]|nr:endonuclease domain-containing protein [Phycisphaerae bacterium]
MNRKSPRASKHMIARSRQLRRDSSFPERLLWSKLRNHRCDELKFRRQHPIGPYVVDFFCASVGVVVELDGRSHEDQLFQDMKRQKYLEQQGFRVIRFTNDQLLSDLDGVVEAIIEACNPSHSGGGQGEGENSG